MAASSTLSNFLSSLSLSKPTTPPPNPSLLSLSSSTTPRPTFSLTLKTPNGSLPIPITPNNHHHSSSDFLSVVCPSLAFSNTLFFKSGYNVQVVVGDNEPEEKLIGRFRRDVLRAGVIQECKRRRFFETKREEKKRKTREAARRNRKRRPLAKALQQDKQGGAKKKADDEDDLKDNWEFIDVELPYQ